MANQALLRRINLARCMNAIREHSPLSRSRIADLLGLDRKSVTNLVGELQSKGLVYESGKRQTGKGRPLVMLEFRRDRNWVMGLALSATSVDGVLLDLYGDVVGRARKTFAFEADFVAIQSAVQSCFTALRKHAGDRLLEVGLAVPGIVDPVAGMVRRSVNVPALEGRPMLRLLPAGVCGLAVATEESSRAKALAEKWFGVARDVPSFVCVDLGVGIGAGIVQDRRLYAGETGYVGEIGHTIIERGGAQCRCGHRGCLEAYVSERVLLDRIGSVEGHSLASFDQVDVLSPASVRILEEAGFRLGVALSYLVNIICPPLIVLSGPLTRFEQHWMRQLAEGLDEGALPACRERVRLRSSPFSNAGAMGAGARALADLFEVQGHFYV